MRGSKVVLMGFIFLTILSSLSRSGKLSAESNNAYFKLENGTYTMIMILKFSNESEEIQEQMKVEVINDNGSITIVNSEDRKFSIIGELEGNEFTAHVDNAGGQVEFTGSLASENVLKGDLAGQSDDDDITVQGTFVIEKVYSNPNDDLLQAIQERNVELVKLSVEHGANISITALLSAMEEAYADPYSTQKFAESVRYLIEHKIAGAAQKDSSLMAFELMMLALEKQDIEAARNLIREGDGLTIIGLCCAYASSASYHASKVMNLSKIAETLATIGKTQEADEIFSQALELTQMTEDNNSASLGALGTAFAKAKNIEQALEIAQSVKSEYHKCQVLITAAEVLIELNKLSEAESLLDQAFEETLAIEHKLLQGLRLIDIANILLQIEKFQKAEEVVNKILEIASDDQDSIILLGNSADAIVRTNNHRKIIDGAELALSVQIRIAEALAETKKHQEAEDIIKHISERIKSVSNEDKVRLLTLTAPVMATLGERSRAEDTLEQATLIIPSVEDSLKQDRLLGNIMEAHLKMNDIEEALDIISSAHEIYRLDPLIQALSKPEHFRRILNDVVSKPKKNDAYGEVLLDIALRALSLHLEGNQQTEIALSIMEHYFNLFE
ncbi:MAG: hypothetical protein JXI43_07910 [Tissierellales bacterium]|nr:hypothetical protein [Tissierellales bacterium]